MRMLLTLFVGFNITLSLAQTVNPPDLLCASRLQNGDVVLNWALPSNTCGSFISYHIYTSKNPNGPFQLLDSISNQSTTSYTHVGADCNSGINYYYMTSRLSCPGGTVISSDTLDCLDPEPPEIDYVSVYNSGVEIYFRPSASPEAAGYIIYRDRGGFNPIDTIYGRFNTFYYDPTASPDQQIEIYTVATIDACGNVGPFNNNPHQTILLTTSKANCRIEMSMVWTRYNNWPGDSVGEHRIEYSLIGGLYQLDTILPSNIRGYTFTRFNDGDNLCIRVGTRAPSDTFISYSNAYCEKIQIVQPSRYVHLRNATIENNEQVKISWRPDRNADLVSFRILRSNDGINFSVIDLLTAPSFPPFEMFYYDTDPRSVQNSKYYRIESVDSCNNALESGTAHTMFLQGKAKPNLVNTIEWNPFSISGGTVNEYRIYRNIDGNWSLLAQATPGTGSKMRYDDDISSLNNTPGHFCYLVEAEGNIQYQNGDTATFVSTSNELCVSQLTRIYAPTAILIGGKNNEFKPVVSFEQQETYHLRIFSRWGELLFESFDVAEGWDGRYRGEYVMQGVYTYLITVTGINGNEVRKEGTFMVIR